MARSRFVHPHTDTLTLDNGDTLTVRRRLNVGEQRASFRACYDLVDGNGAGPTLTFDPTRVGFAKVAAFLVDWAIGPDTPPVRDLDITQRIALLENLDPADFAEVKDAIDAHEARQIAARLEEKKQAATTNAGQTSTSPSGVGGASTGSATSTPTTIAS